MIHMLLQALFGLVVGLVAGWFLHIRHGIFLTAVIGLIGGWIGGRLGGLFGLKEEGNLMHFVLAVVGAGLFMVVLHMINF